MIEKKFTLVKHEFSNRLAIMINDILEYINQALETEQQLIH